MTRIWSTEAEPHRVLEVHDDPQRGEDIRALQVACHKRLDQRGIHREFPADGIFGPKTKAAFDTAAWYLGALKVTVEGEPFPIGAQAMVRYPGRRNRSQLDRAKARTEELRRQRDAAHRKKAQAEPRPSDKTFSGLTTAEANEATSLATDAFALLYKHGPAVHYSQGAHRWDGITRGLKAYRGQYPTEIDCSAAYTWAWWNGLDHYGVGDVLNGQHFLGGYTGTLLLHGEPVSNPFRGCAIIYGNAWPGEHVAFYDEDDLVYSQGSEPGPFHIDMHYRRDILSIRNFVR